MTSPLIGRVVGTYRIEAMIGAGGMGEVFRAHDSKLDRPVALKLLPAEVAAEPDRLRRFVAEARAVSSLNHPNILVIHDVGDVDGRPFIVSELVEGETLRQQMTRGRIAPAEAVRIGLQVSAALAAAHSRGIVHRDIKPDNVMIRPDGYAKVLDFGLMKLMPSVNDAMDETGTEPGRVLGTPHYMSPEQARGLDVGPRSDVWSVGVLMYEMLAGRRPFAGPSAADVIAAILHDELTPGALHAVQVPEPLSRLVMTALSKNAERRHESGAALYAALGELPSMSDARGVGPADGVVGPHATVGRARERAEMLAAFRRVVSGHGELLSVSGEPGAGKTTLTEAFLRGLSATEAQPRVGRGRCSERLAGTEAYLPVLEALDSLVSGGGPPVAEQLSALAPAWYGQVAAAPATLEVSRPVAQSQAVSQERLKRELTAFLRELSRARPLILFFDDVHWADTSTIDLLTYLAARFDELRVLIVATSRPSDLLLTRHLFLDLRRSLQARHVCHEILLDMLTLSDVEAYLALEFAGHRFPSALPALIHSKTEGNPLFMADLVRYLANDGTLAKDSGGQWMLHGALAAIGDQLPASVRAMIERKIAQLGDDERTLLTAASVQGYVFDCVVVARVLARDAGELEERLEVLARVHRFVALVDERELPDGTLTSRYRFVHVLYQNALYEQLRATRRVALSAAVANTLLHFYGGKASEIASELAALYEAARDSLRAAQHCRVAALHASRLSASQEAVVLAARGLRLLEGAPETRERLDAELGLLIGLGNAFIALRGYASDEVRDTYTRAVEVSDRLGETGDRAAVLYGITAFHLVGGRHPTALAHAEDMLEFTERTGHPAQIVAHRMAGWALLAMGQPESALPHFERCRAFNGPEHHALAYTFGQEPGMAARALLAVTLQRLGRTAEAKRACEEALELSHRTTHANSRCYVLHFASMYAQLAGDRQLTRSLSEEALRIAEEQGLSLWKGWCSTMRGWALADDGELEAGVAEMSRGIAAARDLGHELCNSYYLALLAEMLGRATRFEEATARLDDAERLVTANTERFFAPRIAELRAQIALDRGPTG